MPEIDSSVTESEYDIDAEMIEDAWNMVESGGDGWECAVLGLEPGSPECQAIEDGWSEESAKALVVQGANMGATAVCAAYGAGAAAPLCGVAAGWITDKGWDVIAPVFGDKHAAVRAKRERLRAQEANWLGYLDAALPAYEAAKETRRQAAAVVAENWHVEFEGMGAGGVAFSRQPYSRTIRQNIALSELGGAQLARVGSLMLASGTPASDGSPVMLWPLPHPQSMYWPERGALVSDIAETDPAAAAQYAAQIYYLYSTVMRVIVVRAAVVFAALELEAATVAAKPALLSAILLRWSTASEAQRAAVGREVSRISGVYLAEGWSSVAPSDRVIYRLAAGEAMVEAAHQTGPQGGDDDDDTGTAVVVGVGLLLVFLALRKR